MRFPKPPKPLRSRSYMQWVKTHPCCNPVCGRAAPTDAHHFPQDAKGRKTDDYRTVPLCRPCHTAWHEQRELPGLDRGESRQLMYRVQVDLLMDWFARGEGEA